MIDFDDATERVSIVLEGEDPFREGWHAWKVTIRLPWLVVGYCTTCHLLASVSGAGVLYLERTPSGMRYDETAPAACVYVAPAVRVKDVPRGSPPAAQRVEAATVSPAGRPGAPTVQLPLTGAA